MTSASDIVSGDDSFDTDLLKNLLAVIDYGGFTAAAGAINSTQSTVSAKVGRLEEQVGHRLLERDRRGKLALTPHGDVIVRLARDVVRLQKLARQRLNASPVSGTVRIGMSDDFASGRGLTKLLGRFAAEHPEICVEVTIGSGGDLPKTLGPNDLDYVLCKMEGHTSVGAVELWRERLVWTGSTSVTLVEGDEVRLVTFPPPCSYRSRALEALRRQHRQWRIVYVSPSLAGVRAALAADLGITLLPQSLVDGETVVMPSGALPDPGEMAFGLQRRPGIDDPAVLLLGELLHGLRVGWAKSDSPMRPKRTRRTNLADKRTKPNRSGSAFDAEQALMPFCPDAEALAAVTLNS